jgi:hypothetical protein
MTLSMNLILVVLALISIGWCPAPLLAKILPQQLET